MKRASRRRRWLPLCLCLVVVPAASAEPATADTPVAETAVAEKPLPGVSISGQRSNQGWTIAVHLADPDWVHGILYRFDDDPTWYDTGVYPVVDPATGRLPPNRWFNVRGAWVTPGVHRVTVKLVGAEGAERGPFEFPFDFQAEALAWAKYSLRQFVGEHWVSFWDQDDRKGSALLFGSLLSFKDSLAEIRYSLDTCDVGRRFPLRPWTDLARAPGIEGDEDPLIRIPFTVQYACVQIVWSDGEQTEIRRFEHTTAQAAAGGG